jgi:protein-L-isoaspartate O-methyltransferase
MNSSHADLINSLRQTERLTDKTAQTMLQVDRKYFLDPDNLEVLHHAYQVHASSQPLATFLGANYAGLCLPTM